MFKRIDTVFLEVSDIQQSIDWYTTILGFELRWQHGVYAALNVSETPLTLVQKNDDFQPNKKSLFNFYVSDVNEAHSHLVNNEVKVEDIQVEDDVSWFVFYDLDGNRLEVCHF
ncbi:VOC family protein [Cytobacillus suaedae]|nr:VOC family protein [Cytobacillus suaedae]